MHLYTLAKARLVADEIAKLRSERVRQTVGIGSDQYPRIGLFERQKYCAVLGDDGFSGSGGARYAGRTAIIALD